MSKPILQNENHIKTKTRGGTLPLLYFCKVNKIFTIYFCKVNKVFTIYFCKVNKVFTIYFCKVNIILFFTRSKRIYISLYA